MMATPSPEPASAESGAAAPPAGRPSHRRFILIGLVFLHTLHTYIDRVCISAATGEIKAELGIGDQMMGHIFGAFAIGYALFQIPAGWMADRFGPRRALAWVVAAWSFFTAATGLAFNAASLLVIRFLFGVGESGAFPGATRALYAWLPPRERGIAQGIFHSGARVGAALSLLLLPWLIGWIGWRWMFLVAGASGLLWVSAWYWWYRDNPAQHRAVNAAELALITRGAAEQPGEASAPLWSILTSWNLLLATFQYIASNATFFISFTWLLPYLQTRWGPAASMLAPVPLVCGTFAQWFSGWTVTTLHRHGAHVASRRLPAIVGFVISATGLILCATASPDSPTAFVVCFSIAVFGVEMTISPSWAFCMDIGGAHSGTVSGAMNMVGNLGSAASAILFPWFIAHVTLPVVAERTGTANSFFVFAAGLNLLGATAWLGMNPLRAETAGSPARRQWRIALFVALLVLVAAAVVLPKFFLK
ncbi:MAG: MFS transporter [Opitutaceae bacterium]|nr:MFS transporter [Opitutaceae bacterium]